MMARRAGVRLFFLFFALYALTSSGNAFRVPDEFEVYFQTEHLVDAGDLTVPQTLHIKDNGEPIFFGKIGLDGRPYAPYGPGVAFLLLPFHGVGRLVARAAGVPRAPLPSGVAWELVVGGITALGMAFAAALAVAGFFRTSAALGASEAQATRLSLILGACTILWPYGTTLYSEAWLAAAFVWAAALLVESRRDLPANAGSYAIDRHQTARRAPSRRSVASAFRRKILVAAVLVALAILTKPTAIVIAPAFVVAVLLESRVNRRARLATAAVLSVAIAVAAGIHVAWNIARFGRALDFGYNLVGMIPHPPARPFIAEQIPEGLFLQLLTPGKSLFVWAPATLVALLALGACWKRQRALAAGLVVATASALLFYAAFFFPDGGYAHGPRHLVPLVPLLMLPLAVPGVDASRGALRVSAAAGFVIAALAVTVSFFEDQAPVRVGDRLISTYYHRVDPVPGGPNLRYRTDYIPFKFALTSGHWLAPTRPVGNGPDFFALHLIQARRTLPGGAAIPSWLPWAVSLPWVFPVIWCARSALKGLTHIAETDAVRAQGLGPRG
jgi:hypothetical protein